MAYRIVDGQISTAAHYMFELTQVGENAPMSTAYMGDGSLKVRLIRPDILEVQVVRRLLRRFPVEKGREWKSHYLHGNHVQEFQAGGDWFILSFGEDIDQVQAATAEIYENAVSNEILSQDYYD